MTGRGSGVSAGGRVAAAEDFWGGPGGVLETATEVVRGREGIGRAPGVFCADVCE